MINIVNIHNTKRVNKPWGYELWLECSDNSPYVVKILHIKAGKQFSLQTHANKIETMVIVDGDGRLHTSDTDIDIARWENNGYSSVEITDLLYSVYEIPISTNDVLTIHPGKIHRISAITDIQIIECSTPQLTDVIRISDDYNRPSGHIASEHHSESAGLLRLDNDSAFTDI